MESDLRQFVLDSSLGYEDGNIGKRDEMKKWPILYLGFLLYVLVRSKGLCALPVDKREGGWFEIVCVRGRDRMESGMDWDEGLVVDV